MINAKEIWIIEYSPSQKMFHAYSLEECAQFGLRMVGNYREKKRVPDYITVGYAGSFEEAAEVCEKLEVLREW